MEKSIILNKIKVDYFLKQSKGRNLRMQISVKKNEDGESKATLIVSKPRFVLQYFVDKYLQSKSDWILKKLELVQNRIDKNKKMGHDFKNLNNKDLKKRYKADKEAARVLVQEKLQYWKNFYQTNFNIIFTWNRVSIKNTQTRWGSCSSKKNLNFSFKIIYLKNEEQDYLIVHELSHLLQMNHSKNFWQLVSLGVSNYKNLRKSMRGI